MIGFPHWYKEPDKTQYPPDLGHMSLAVRRPSIYDGSVHKFTVVVGSHAEYQYTVPFDVNLKYTGERYSKQLGMNFIAFDSSFENVYMKVGFVGKYDQINDKDVLYSGPGWYAIQEAQEIDKTISYYQPRLKNFQFHNGSGKVIGRKGGVRIHFETEFDDIPAVIITPVLEEGGEPCSHRGGWDGDEGRERGFYWSSYFFTVPHCVVETITKGSIFVKCGCIEQTYYGMEMTEILYSQLPFNFLAVGPATS